MVTRIRSWHRRDGRVPLVIDALRESAHASLNQNGTAATMACTGMGGLDSRSSWC
jgi:hypothetical protein